MDISSVPFDTKANVGEPRITHGSDSSSEIKDGYIEDVSEKELGSLEDAGRRRGEGTFVDADIDGERWRPLDTYEGAHRFDPDFEWADEEEKRLVKRIDMRVCTFVCILFFALQLDRSNISQAVAGGMLDDLGLITNQYNNGQTIFYVSFLFAELPSQLMSKWVGPDNWIPFQMVAWSLVASLQCFITGETSFYITRWLLGMLEGGFIPDTILYLTYWYKSSELPARLSWFWVSYELTFIASALLAFGILRMDGINGMEGWRWLFALEGTLTGLIGVFSWFYMPASPTQTKGGVRGKDGWFSEHEEKILVNRVLRDDPSKGDMHNRQALSPRMFWQTLKDYDLWPVYLVGLTWLIPAKPLEQYLTLQLRGVGFTTFETNLLTIPAYVIFIINLLGWTWVSERFNSRILACLAAPLWNFPLFIALLCIPATASRWALWSLSSLVVGSPYIHAILVSVVSRNAGSVRTRTVATALYNMSVQVGNIVATQIYRTDDAPMYRKGNGGLLGLVVWSFLVFCFIKWYYVRQNQKRELVWNGMTHEEKREYLADPVNRKAGNKRLDFRFAH